MELVRPPGVCHTAVSMGQKGVFYSVPRAPAGVGQIETTWILKMHIYAYSNDKLIQSLTFNVVRRGRLHAAARKSLVPYAQPE